jgi:antitoxin PrlF
MEKAKVLPKHQMTIPKRIRKKLGIKEGDVLLLEVVEDKVVMRKSKRIEDLRGTLPPLQGLSFEEVLDTTVEAVVKEDLIGGKEENSNR